MSDNASGAFSYKIMEADMDTVKVLITGSRDASPQMLEYARSVVRRAHELGWEIIVGDAEGVDAAVIAECDRLGVPVEVHGAYGRMRRSSAQGNNIAHHLTSYLDRDDVMADRCDWCIAVWNGSSRGTKHTYEYAQKLGKKVFIHK